MKPEEIMDALNTLDDDIVEAVDQVRQKQDTPRRRNYKWIGLAACFCVVVTAAFLFQQMNGPIHFGGAQETADMSASAGLEESKENQSQDAVAEGAIAEDTLETRTNYMFMLNGHLYTDTGETESRVTCGTMDVGFDKVIPSDEIPDEDGEANFESEFNGAQRWRQENRLVSCVDGVWRIFAYNENNLDGVTMTVTKNTNTSLSIAIENQGGKEINFGDDFTIQKMDEEVDEWRELEPVIDNFAFQSIAYVVDPEKTMDKTIDIQWLYGKLEPGNYRVVKTILVCNDDGKYETYWYLSDFLVK